MWYVGLDVHLKTSSMCMLNEHGEQVRQRTIRGSWAILLKFLREIERPFAICYEASCGYALPTAAAIH